jgi:uncharacterized protein involved in response to NO
VRGHRPFFIGAAAFAVLAMTGWLGILDASLPAPGRLGPGQWHGHEMLFGYTMAVLAGFLLTGSTGRRPAMLFALWLAGRLAMTFSAELPPGVVAAIDLAFAPALGLLRTPSLWASFKRPTIGFAPLLACIFTANLLWHLDALGVASWGARAGELLVIDLFTLMIVVMAGRLVPGYTRAMLIPVRQPKDPIREKWSIGIALALLVSDALQWSALAGLFALALGALQAWRLALWRTRDVIRRPLLLVLHAGFAWLVAGLALRGAAALTPWISATDALHATTVGAIGMLTLGMMSRLARIHARRELLAGAADIAGYATLFCAGIARVAVPALVPEARGGAILAAGILWVLAFVFFLVEHGRALGGGGSAARSSASRDQRGRVSSMVQPALARRFASDASRAAR